jgi:protoporphyrinogen/coproporphyrinogen III oxidase
VSTEHRDVVVVGGGAAGMAAAWQLRDKDIVLLEQNDVLGGRMKSHGRGDYWLNLGAHLFPVAGAHVRNLMDELGLETVEVPGSKTALSFKGKVHDARRIESYPFVLPLTLTERLQLMRAGLIVRLKVRSYLSQSRPRPGESATERQARMSRFDKDRTFQSLLGRLPGAVDAIFRTAARRVPAEMEELSAAAGISIFAGNWAGKASGSPVNLLGGSGRLGEAVRRRLGERAVLGARVVSVEQDGDGAVVTYDSAEGRSTITARHVIVATPAPVASALVPGLAPSVKESLGSVAYAPFVSMAILTHESGPMPWDDIYAILTPGLSFNMLFNHANPLRGSSIRSSGGSLMVYAGAQPARELLELPDDEIARRFTQDLLRVYPQLGNLISETIVQKWVYGNWYETPRSDLDALLAYRETPDNVIHLAGDYFAPVSGSVEGATTSGVETARHVASALDSVGRTR